MLCLYILLQSFMRISLIVVNELVKSTDRLVDHLLEAELKRYLNVVIFVDFVANT